MDRTRCVIEMRNSSSAPSGSPPLWSQSVVESQSWSWPGTLVTVHSRPYVPTWYTVGVASCVRGRCPEGYGTAGRQGMHGAS
jgi:hypothetical protein